ncbi:MAG TPA: peptidyl-prolyl cis-trans isomerase [Chromatiales bacterium]|nr:peptidyl-prolyl cis-trans isomerase [Chromatiales bacterium]
MQKPIFALLLVFCLALGVSDAALAAGVQVRMQTTMGVITLELDPAKAPKTVKNFTTYAKEGFYDGTIFHRVIPDFMVQGGGYTPDMKRKETHAPIPNEADNGLKNDRGTIAMARTSDPHSATAQFFINLKDNDFLNFRSKDPRGWGYAVFGKVVDGMDVVDKIAAQSTGSHPNGMRDVPRDTIAIENLTVIDNQQ